MALFPGMSRSASTIIGGILVGMTLTGTAEFSFFLAIPTMLAATSLSLFTGVSELTLQNWIVLGVGFAVSFVTALIVVDRFITFLKKYSLRPFDYYRLFIGIINTWQYLDILNCRFIDMEPEKRLKSISTICTVLSLA